MYIFKIISISLKLFASFKTSVFCKCALVTRSPVHICVHQFGHCALLTMRVNIPLLFLTLTFWSIISQTLAFSDNFCENICYFTPWLCAVCTSVHGSDFETRAEKEVKVKLMPITKVANIYLFFNKLSGS